MRFATLAEWLDWQEKLHPRAVDLGLERVGQVLGRLDIPAPPGGIITVGGTNGKGSCVAFLEAMLLAAERRVGAYTSPHLLDYNERIRIGSAPAADGDIMVAFQRVDDARGEVRLTYFEFGTLAALWMFAQARCEVWLLEVGLGGRLDAVNAVDADVAVITSVEVDHVEWLGSDRAAIGFEKAGIMRRSRPVVLGETEPPESVLAHARSIGAVVWRLGRDFRIGEEGSRWGWASAGRRLDGLPQTAMAGPHQRVNAACAIAALEALAPGAIPEAAIRHGLVAAHLPGRLQIVPGAPEWIFDVAHNPAAAAALADSLATRPAAGKTHAVLGMLADKDAAGFARALRRQVDHWYAADLGYVDRGLSDVVLRSRLSGTVEATPAGSVAEACALVTRIAGPRDRILVCGSFHTVGAALRSRETH